MESLNVPVSQAPVDAEQVRGLALSAAEPNAIQVSGRDRYEARIFTLLHEYGHLLLREGDGMCTPAADAEADGRRGKKAERWCNEFAAEALMPEGEFCVELRGHECTDARETVGLLAKRFRAGRRAVVLRAMKVAGKGRAGDCRRLLEELSGGRARGRRGRLERGREVRGREGEHVRLAGLRGVRTRRSPPRT